MTDLRRDFTEWHRAGQHFDAAAAALAARDYATFDRELSAFRAIANTWKPRERAEAKNLRPSNQ